MECRMWGARSRAKIMGPSAVARANLSATPSEGWRVALWLRGAGHGGDACRKGYAFACESSGTMCCGTSMWHELTYAAHSLGGVAWLRGAGHGGDASRCAGGMCSSLSTQ